MQAYDKYPALVVQPTGAADLQHVVNFARENSFYSIVRGGALTENGMPAYAHLTDTELESLRHYIRQQAEVGLAN